MLAFLSSLTTGPSPLGSNTVKVYRSALALPLRYGFQINTNDRMFTLLAKHQSLANPPVAKIVPQWSLEKVLLFLTSTAFSPPPLFYYQPIPQNTLPPGPRHGKPLFRIGGPTPPHHRLLSQ